MRVRTWMCVAASVAVVAAAGPASAAPVRTVAPSAGSTRLVPGALEPAARTVTLVTGQQVRVSGPAGRERVSLVRRDASAGDALTVRRLPGHLYVFPVAVEPYLGRSLDLALFDLDARRGSADDRTAVRISYRGERPVVPGVHVTSASDGVARGYITNRSASDFGRAVRHAAAGQPSSGVLFPGTQSIGAADGAPPAVEPRYPMKTLVVKVLTADGKPQAEGLVFLVNVDDASRYIGLVLVEKGEARVSVPAGTYSAISDDWVVGPTEDTGTITVDTVNEYVVTGAGQTLTLDHRGATARPSVGTPKPAESRGLYVEWDRVDAAEDGSVGSGYFVDPGFELRLTPSEPARVGTVSLLQSWALEQQAKNPAYVYSVASIDDHIPADLRHTYTTADLGTVEATYEGDGSGSLAASGRLPFFDDEGGSGGYLLPVARGIRRTEYVGSTAPAEWSDTTLVNIKAEDDPGFFDAASRTIPAGSTSTQTWFRGPLAPRVPVQESAGYCFGCRSGNTLNVGLVPVTDNDPGHYGSLFGAGDEQPVARFQLYRGSKLLADEDDAVGATLAVRAKKGTYRAVIDVDRRQNEPRLSTRSRTELGFSSGRNQGQKIPEDWFCDGSSTCRALPLLQARVSLPTDLNEQLPLGRSVVTVRAAQVQNAKSSPVVSASLEYRPAGRSWVTVDLQPTAPGVYSGVIDTSDQAGTVADLRVSAADKAGSTFRQTVTRSFTVAGAR